MIHKHHRQLRRHGDDSPVNVIGLPDVIHQWVHDNPAAAEDAGLIVPSYKDPAEIMVTIPEEALKKARKPRRKKEPARNRENVQVRVPKDEREDGAGILDDLITMARDQLAPTMGWEDDVPPYYVLIAVLHDWLTTDA